MHTELLALVPLLPQHRLDDPCSLIGIDGSTQCARQDLEPVLGTAPEGYFIQLKNREHGSRITRYCPESLSSTPLVVIFHPQSSWAPQFIRHECYQTRSHIADIGGIKCLWKFLDGSICRKTSHFYDATLSPLW